MRCPTIYNSPVLLADSAKYLGVTLDRKLLWSEHLQTISDKAIKALWVCRQFAGKTWGTSPRIILWIYKAIVRPIVEYGAVVWWKKSTTKDGKTKLGKIQRLACLTATGAIRSCPTVALEALLDLPPLHIHIKAEAKIAVARLKACQNFLKLNPEQTNWVNEDHVLSMPSDHLARELCFKIPFSTEIWSREDWNLKLDTLPSNVVTWYTDGSKTEDGTGAGVVGPSHKISIPMGKYATVFQAEVHAIETCANTCLAAGYQGRNIAIFTDSQAAIKALSNFSVSSKVVLSGREALQRLGSVNKVTIYWVPGHAGIPGNETADELARGASATPLVGPEPYCGIPLCSARRHIREWEHSVTIAHWDNTPGLRQAKLFIAGHSRNRTHELLRLRRNRVRTICGLLTGHFTLRGHLHRMGIVSDPSCRFCESEDETSQHILCDCDALHLRRLKCFGDAFPEAETIASLTLEQLSRFVGMIGLEN